MAFIPSYSPLHFSALNKGLCNDLTGVACRHGRAERHERNRDMNEVQHNFISAWAMSVSMTNRLLCERIYCMGMGK